MKEILFVDDDPAMRKMVVEMLRSAGFDARALADGATALQQLPDDPPDLVILDFRMKPLDGFTVCKRIKSTPRLAHIPVLILTAQGRVDDRVAGFEAGANDYLPKPFEARELIARARALLQLSEQARDRNPTSGLPGGEAIRTEYARRREAGEPFALCYLDLDNFKPFGDHFGFSLGDDVIRAAAEAIEDSAGPDDFVGHVGGDDFLLIGPCDGAREKAEAAQARFRAGLARLLPAEVVRAGGYQGVGRDGKRREFALTRLSAALLYVDPAHFATLAEMSRWVADAKQAAKEPTGSGLTEVDLRSGAAISGSSSRASGLPRPP